MASIDPWYFPRKALADEFLDLFEISGTAALTLFAQRRTGKTSFLTHDLEPAAAKRGYVPIFIDFWEVIGDATTALLDVLDQTLQEIEVPKSRLGKLLSTPIRSVGWKDFALEFGELPERKKPSHKLLQFRWYLSQIVGRTRRPALLMLDEFQQVALDAEGEKLAASLRSSLQRLHPAVRAVFSGSSESRLAEMFRRTRAPLFDFSAQMPFPKLDRDFVRFICERHKKSTGRNLNEKTLWEAFIKLDRQPKALKELVLELIKAASTDIGAVIEEYARRIATHRDEALENRLRPLKALPRLILSRIASGEGPTSKMSQAFYTKQLGLETINPNTLNRALKQLLNLDLIVRRTEGGYRLTDDAIAEYIRTNTVLKLVETG